MISASIVTYNNNPAVLARTIDSYLSATNGGKLYVIDNSPNDSARALCSHPSIEYWFNTSNLGYGRAHNIAIKKEIDKSRYHLVLNPDVYFSKNVVNDLVEFLEVNDDVGLVMPKILYPDGRLQKLCKLLPKPHELVARRFLKSFDKILAQINYEYEMHFTGYESVTEVPILSGCFMMLRMDALKEIGLFDERYFLYFEDTDLSRRVHQRFKTIYFPHVQVYHVHGRGLHKDYKLLLAGVKSAIQYFNKWGWLTDTHRDEINRAILTKYKVNGYKRK
jgi:GT2 family glycosyltransferase